MGQEVSVCLVYWTVKLSVFVVYTLKNAGLKITQRWVKKGRTQWLGYFDPSVGRGGKSRGVRK